MMRTMKFWTVLGTAALVCSLGLLSAGAAEHSKLEDYMDVVNNNYKKLRTDARRGNFGEAQLKLVREMQVASVQSTAEVPPLTAKQKSDADKAKFIIAYKQEMKKMTVALLDLEILMLEGKKDEVLKMLEDLNKLKSEGHEKFTEQ